MVDSAVVDMESTLRRLARGALARRAGTMKASELEAAPSRSRAEEVTRIWMKRDWAQAGTRSRGWVRAWMSNGLESRKGDEGPEERQRSPIEHKPSVA